MRIVQVSPYDIERPGGVQRHILALAAGLRRRGHETLIIAPGPLAADGPDFIRPIGHKREIGMSGTRFELTWARPEELRGLQQCLTEWQPDLLHFHTLWSPAMPFQVFRRWSGPRVVTFHDTPPPGLWGGALRLSFGAMGRWIMARSSAVIAVSSAPLAHLRHRRGGLEPVVVPPATDLSAVTARGRRDRGSADAAIRFLFVGRLERRKGIVELLHAWDRVRRTGGQNLVLTVAGKGEYAALVRNTQSRVGSNRLEFIEAPDDDLVRQLYARADVFVAPSPFGESFGIVLTEAMANGLPVIAADNAGYSTVLIGPGRDGIVRSGDVSALADAMIRFASNKPLRDRLGAWGIEQAASYDISAHLPRFERIYHDSIDRHRQERAPP
jgi:phosphatidylinositol alpha-mannosyltransferase